MNTEATGLGKLRSSAAYESVSQRKVQIKRLQRKRIAIFKKIKLPNRRNAYGGEK